MIAIKIELWPYGSEKLRRDLGRMYIANDGTGSLGRGDYKIAVCRRGTDEVPAEIYPADHPVEDKPKAARTGEVKDYPRLAYNVWRLIARAVLAAFPEEAKASKKVGSTIDESVMRGLRIFADPQGPPNECPADAADRRAAIEWLSQGDAE